MFVQNLGKCIGMPWLPAWLASNNSWKAWCALVTRKRNVKPRFYLILMAVLVVVFLGVYVSQSSFMATRDRQIAELEEQQREAEQHNAELERKISFAKTDEYIERTAREKFGLVKPGEIRLVSGNELTGSAQTNGATQP